MERPHTAGMDVLIAGAGIAGLSAGIAMAKAGHSVVIAERASELREIGAALSLWPNAPADLDPRDAGDVIRAAAVEAPTGSIFSAQGASNVDLISTRCAEPPAGWRWSSCEPACRRCSCPGTEAHR